MLSRNQLGFLYMVLSVCAFSMMDVLVKWSENYPVGQVLFFRGICGLIPIFFLIPKEKYTNFYKTDRPKLHFARCAAGLMAIVSIFIALRNLPLATVVSISFAAPIFATILSIYFLSEKIGKYRWLAVFIGFLGVIIITQPGISTLNFYYIYPIIFCLGMSYVAIAIRQLSTSEPVWLISFYFSLAISILGLFTVSFGWVMPTFFDFILLCMIGLLGGVANLLLGQSYKLSEVSLVSPLKYLSLIFAIVFGYFIWNEVPSFKTISGAALVVLSSIIIFRREIYLKKPNLIFKNE
jgi:drug/metabolite transporter (DMT)-like permease